LHKKQSDSTIDQTIIDTVRKNNPKTVKELINRGDLLGTVDASIDKSITVSIDET